jgi:flagellar protein FliO/FliZ
MDASTLLWSGLVLAGLCALLLLAPRLVRGLGLDPAQRPGRRVGVIEVTAVDPRRRLVLARCDGREVLLLTGGGTDLVVGWLPQGAGPPPARPPLAPAPDDLA